MDFVLKVLRDCKLLKYQIFLKKIIVAAFHPLDKNCNNLINIAIAFFILGNLFSDLL